MEPLSWLVDHLTVPILGGVVWLIFEVRRQRHTLFGNGTKGLVVQVLENTDQIVAWKIKSERRDAEIELMQRHLEGNSKQLADLLISERERRKSGR